MCYIDSKHPAVSKPFPRDLSGMTDKRRERNNRKKLSSCWELLVYNIKKSFAPKSNCNYPPRALREDNDCLHFKGDYLAPLSMRSSRVFRRGTGWSPQPRVLPLLMEKPWKSRNNWTLISMAKVCSLKGIIRAALRWKGLIGLHIKRCPLKRSVWQKRG